MEWYEELERMGFKLAATCFWDGKDTILTVCDPDMPETERQNFASKLQRFPIQYHPENVDEILAIARVAETHKPNSS